MGYNENLERQCVKAYLDYITEGNEQLSEMNQDQMKSFKAELQLSYKMLKEIKSMLDTHAKNFGVRGHKNSPDEDTYDHINFLRKVNNGLRGAWSELKYKK